MLKKYNSILICLLISFILLVGTENHRKRKANFLSKFLYWPWLSIKTKYENLIDAEKENDILKARNARLQLQNIKLINELRFKLPDFELSTKENIDFLVADVIAVKGNSFDKNFIVNKGKEDSVKVDFPVIRHDGIIGKITSVGLNYSVVLPYSHPDFKVAVMNKRNGVQGIFKTVHTTESLMSMIPIESEINIGDTIITSNLSFYFPKGIPVGSVKKIKSDKINFSGSAELDMFADLNKMEEVIILQYNGAYDEK